jgi:4-aminobutyrate aminotransferase-like enzyme
VLREERLIERASECGAALIRGLRRVAADVPGIREVRGRGLMIGIEIDPSALAIELPGLAGRTPTLVAQALVVRLLAKHRLLTQSTSKGSGVIKIVPPLVISNEDVDWIVEAFRESLMEIGRGRGAAVRGLLGMLQRAPGVVVRESFH